MTKMHQLAAEYLIGLGYSVIPVGPDKRPLVAWKEFQARFATEDELKIWYKEGSTAQIGIATGKLSNLTVIDIEAEGDATVFLGLDTYIVKTGGGGYHAYFQYEAEIANSVRTLPFTDVRSEGGYVVAAGSASSKGEYSVVKESVPMKMPEAIKKLFVKESPSAASLIPRDDTKPPEYDGAGEGSRNDSMAKYIGRILATMAPMYWEATAWPMVLAANQKNTPPLSEYELRMVFKSISEREAPRTAERRYGGRRPLPASQSANPEISPQDVAPIITLEEAAKSQKIDVDNTTSTNIEIFDEALMGGFSPGDLVIIAGRSGVGKTTLAQDFTSSFLSAGHGALWFSYEVMAVPLYRKFQEMQLSDQEFGNLFVPAPPMTTSLDDIEQIVKNSRQEKNIKLLAVDHIGFIDPDMKTHGNHALAITHIVRGLKRLAVENEMVVILPVHVRKVDTGEPSLEDVRDSYGVVQEADVVFLIDRKRAATAAERAESYYSDHVRIMLAKNRKTGVSKSGIFSLISGRYAYQESLSEADEGSEMSYGERKKQKSAADKVWEEMSAEKPE